MDDQQKGNIVDRIKISTLDEYIAYELEYEKLFNAYFKEWYELKNKENHERYPLLRSELGYEWRNDALLVDVFEHWKDDIILGTKPVVIDGRIVLTPSPKELAVDG